MKLKLSKANLKALRIEEKRLFGLFEEAEEEVQVRPGITGKYAAYLLGKLHFVQDLLGMDATVSHLNKKDKS